MSRKEHSCGCIHVDGVLVEQCRRIEFSTRQIEEVIALLEASKTAPQDARDSIIERVTLFLRGRTISP